MPTDYSTMTVPELRSLCRGRGLDGSGPAAGLIARLQAADAAGAARSLQESRQSRLAHAERLLDIARRGLDSAIQRAAARGDLDEVAALHRDRRLLGTG